MTTNMQTTRKFLTAKPSTMSRVLAAAGLATLTAVTLAACGSSGAKAGGPTVASPASGSPSAVDSATGTPVPSQSVPSASTTVPTATITTASQAAGRPANWCAESQLRASIDPRHVPGNGTRNAKGQTMKGLYVDFRNTSSTTCVLYGYPGADTVNADGSSRVHATRTLRGDLGGLPSSQTGLTNVPLAPGASAAAMIEGVDQQQYGAAQAGCAMTTPRILVTPPNTETPVPFLVQWGYCYSFTVHPVQSLN